jgi:hypothetical protein
MSATAGSRSGAANAAEKAQGKIRSAKIRVTQLISLHSDGRIQGIPRELNTPERVFAQSNGRGQENPNRSTRPMSRSLGRPRATCWCQSRWPPTGVKGIPVFRIADCAAARFAFPTFRLTISMFMRYPSLSGPTGRVCRHFARNRSNSHRKLGCARVEQAYQLQAQVQWSGRTT